jgi:hypothetical protein
VKVRDIKMCQACYSFGYIGDLNGDGIIDIIGGGDLGNSEAIYTSEAIYVIFLKDSTWIPPAFIVSFALLGLFAIVGFGLTYAYRKRSRW